MALGGTDITPLDGSLGGSVDLAENTHALIGVASGGATTPLIFSRADDVVAEYGEGPLVVAALQALARLRTVICLRVVPAASPSFGTQVDSLAGGTGTVAIAGAPVDTYDVRVQLTKSGAAGVAEYIYSLDGGVTWSAAGTFATGVAEALEESGVTVTFTDAGSAPEASFVLGATSTRLANAAVPTTAELATAFDLLVATALQFAAIHITGASAAAAWVAMDAKAETVAAALEQHRYLYIMMETGIPSGAYATWVTARAAETASVGLLRTFVVGGFARFSDTRTGRQPARNIAGAVMARDMSNPVHRSAGRTLDGGLRGATALYPEGAMAGAEALQNARLIIARTYPGLAGFYCGKPVALSPVGSDYTRVAHRRVMDKACRLVDQVAVRLVESELDASSAALIAFRSALNAPVQEMVAAGEVTDGRVVVDLSQDVLGTEVVEATVELVPKAYAGTIRVGIRFTNPFNQTA
jgi:hypothetical protein